MLSPIWNHPNCKQEEDAILAFKIYDQCRQKTCDSYGPWISAEPCECIILENREGSGTFGRLVQPGRPVTLPDYVSKVKLVDDSFHVERLGTTVVRPSELKKGCWEIEVCVQYACRLQFLNHLLRPLPIQCVCLEDTTGEIRTETKMDLCVSFRCERRFTMYGGGQSTIACSDFSDCRSSSAGPHALVELQAYPLDVSIVCVEQAVDCDDICDGMYEDTLKYIYITVGSYMMLFVYRIVALNIASSGFVVPHEKPDVSVCDAFFDADIPLSMK